MYIPLSPFAFVLLFVTIKYVEYKSFKKTFLSSYKDFILKDKTHKFVNNKCINCGIKIQKHLLFDTEHWHLIINQSRFFENYFYKLKMVTKVEHAKLSCNDLMIMNVIN